MCILLAECKCIPHTDHVLKVAVHRHFLPLSVAEQAAESHCIYKTYCTMAYKRLRRHDIDEFRVKVWKISDLKVFDPFT